MQELGPYIFSSFYSTDCSSWGPCYALCIAKSSALLTAGKHLSERARGSGRSLSTPCYCLSALFSLRGAKGQNKFKCQASCAACQSRGEHPPCSKDQLPQDQTSEKHVALFCACRMQELREPQEPACTILTLRDQRSQDFTKLLSKLLPCCFWL